MFCIVEKQLLLFSILLKIESKLKEINSKMSYFDKKRHFKNTYIIDIQYSNNFKKKREGVFLSASTINIL